MDEWKHGNMKVWKYGNVNMEVWNYGNVEKWKYGEGFLDILLNFNGFWGISYCFVWFYAISREFQGVLGDFKALRDSEGF